MRSVRKRLRAMAHKRDGGFLRDLRTSSGSQVPNLPEANADTVRPLRIRLPQPTDKVLSICLSVLARFGSSPTAKKRAEKQRKQLGKKGLSEHMRSLVNKRDSLEKSGLFSGQGQRHRAGRYGLR